MAHLVTGKVRLSYEHIWEPASINGSDEKYSVSLIIPKSDTKTVKAIQDAIEQAKQDGKQYGANIEDLVIGKSYGIDFVESELRREIETALLQNEDIKNMSSFFVKRAGSTLNISFTLITVYGKVSGVYAYDTG